MLFKKIPPTQQPTPPWLKWGVILFLILAFTLHWLGIGTPAPTGYASNPAATDANGKLNWGLPSMETYKSRLIPGYGRLQISDSQPGKGAEAVCGQDADIRYTPVTIPPNRAGAVSDKADAKPLTIRLGGTDAPEALQESVIGMREGGKRSVLVPKERTESGMAPVSYVVELLKASPALPEPDKESLPLRIFDRKLGMMQEVHCGDTVKAHLTIWDMSGKRLLDTHEGKGEPLILHLGAGTVMAGIETGIPGMEADGERTLIIPPYLQKPLHEPAEASEKADKPADKKTVVSAAEILHKLTLPEHQAIIVDVDLVP